MAGDNKNNNIPLWLRNPSNWFKPLLYYEIIDRAQTTSGTPREEPIVAYLDNARVGEATQLPQVRYNVLLSTISPTDFIPFAGDALELVLIGDDWSKRNYGLAALGATLFLIPGAWASKAGRYLLRGADKTGEYVFKHLPYRHLNLLDRNLKLFTNDAISFLRSDPTQFRSWYRSNKYRKLIGKARARAKAKIDEDILLPPDVTPNSKLDALELTLERYKHRQNTSERTLFGSTGNFKDYDPSRGTLPLDLDVAKSNLESIKYREYIPIKDIYDMSRNFGESKIKSIFNTPIAWLNLNYNPGLSNSRFKLIHVNPLHLKSLNYDKNSAIAHELVHLLDTRLNPSKFGGIKPAYPTGFSYSHLPPSVRNYFMNNNNTELVARGSQVKNYFGLHRDEPITVDMLKYAAKNYVKDTKMNNNMNLFFSGIKDWNAAAEWLSRYSLKNGGVLRQYKY